jgi:hypothetical protein
MFGYMGMLYEGVSKIFRTDTIKIINLTTKRLWKLPTSTQLRATWHTDSLDMVVLPSTSDSRYHNCCIDGSTSPGLYKHLQTEFHTKVNENKERDGLATDAMS